MKSPARAVSPEKFVQNPQSFFGQNGLYLLDPARRRDFLLATFCFQTFLRYRGC